MPAVKAAIPVVPALAPRARPRRGMTLIEVMIAGAVFAIGASGILSAVGSYMQVVEHERRLGDAWRILQAEVGHLRTLPDAALLWTSPSVEHVDAFGLPTTLPLAKFTVTRTPAADTPHAGARQLQVSLTWQERTLSRSTSVVIHR